MLHEFIVVQSDDTAEALLRRADVGLYAAKRLGRNRAEGSLGGPE